MQVDRFPNSYAEAHERFCAEASALGLRLECFSHGTTPRFGPNLSADVELVTVAAISESKSGNRNRAEHALVISTGLHGVEGYFGTAALWKQFDTWKETGLPSCRVVLLHALNPFGYANHRRVDHLNRDLNRNFLLSKEAYVGAPNAYAALDSFLNPERSTSALAFYLSAGKHVLRSGYAELKQAVAGGQYDYPKGLFYGGDELCKLGHWLEERLPVWLDGTHRVCHVDFHTGLGPRGKYQLFVESCSERWKRDLGNAFPQDSWSAPSQTSAGSMYVARGSFGQWCSRLMHRAGRDYLYALAEFGTYPAIQVLRCLHLENTAYHHEPSMLDTRKAQLLEAFCPASSQWRAESLDGAEEILSKLTKVLNEA